MGCEFKVEVSHHGVVRVDATSSSETAVITLLDNREFNEVSIVKADADELRRLARMLNRVADTMEDVSE